MALLTREQILGVDDNQVEVVEVPEWGGSVGVRTMTGADKDDWEAERQTESGFSLDNIRASFVARTACDENGYKLFSTDDVIELGKKSAKALDRVFQVAKRINQITDDELEEIEKES